MMRPIPFLTAALSLVLSAPALAHDDKKPANPTFSVLENKGPAKGPSLYVVGYSHLDTEWCWNYPQVIREFIPNTLHENFDLFDKYPDYTFNWTGANRYRFMKEYYPEDYKRLKGYIAAGRWFPNGSSLEELDVNNPSSESILRQILYGNQFFRKEFGTAGVDFILPDCFGFPASLPSILHHAGVKGFSTQKLTWGSAVGIPFNVGVWNGPDGQGVVSALNPGSYGDQIDGDLSHDQYWTNRVNGDPLQVDYHYYGTGDRGGSPGEHSVQNLEVSLHGGGPLNIIAGRGDQIFRDITPAQAATLPTYQGDLELTNHSAGSLTSESEMKRWNHKNELLADAAEKSSVMANWLGGLSYDHKRITDAWMRFLPGQFHDLMAGTALPESYVYSWNDEVIAANEFSNVLSAAVGSVTRVLDTRARGVSLVVYNPLSITREDVVEAKLHFPGQVPASLMAIDPTGNKVPVQIKSKSGHDAKVLLLAKAQPVGYSVYDIRPGVAALPKKTVMRVGKRSLENNRYVVTLNENGDIASIKDKLAHKEILSAPARLAYQYEKPNEWPAWNMDWADAHKAPRAFVSNPVSWKIVESGPVRVALQVTRHSEGSTFTSTVRLSSGGSSERVEIAQDILWRGKESALKATFPLTVSNPDATYNWGMGAIQRDNDMPKRFEVAGHDWIDLTDASGNYGVTVLPGFKFGSNKPNDSQINLTLLYTPGVNGTGYRHQATQDWGHHEFVYGLTGHFGNWSAAGTQWEGQRLNQPPIAFQTVSHTGAAGRAFSFARVSTAKVGIVAMKKAENTDEIIVRVQEMSGTANPNTHLLFAAPVVSAREVNGQEETIGAPPVENGQIVFNATPYAPRAFAVRLKKAPVSVPAIHGVALHLPYNLNGLSPAGKSTAGNFDGQGNKIPGELLPKRIESNGVTFRLSTSASKNVLVPKGQTISLPAGTGRTLYVLGASVAGDKTATFTFGSKAKTVNFQAWDGFVGQWDTRLWDAPQPELTYDWPLNLAGLVHGYVKPAPVAWYSDHKRLADGTNDPYAFCYLFKYAISVPDGASSVKLPADSKLRIVAASVAQNINEATVPAQPLFDTLPRVEGPGPVITPAPQASYDDSIEVSLGHALYYRSSNKLRYTTDGSMPTVNSPVYKEPLWISKPTTITVAEFDAAGHVSSTSSAHYEVHDTTAPKVTFMAALPAAPVVQLGFSERLDKSKAETAANYAIEGSTVEKAELSRDGKAVVLHLNAPLTQDTAITLSNVTDAAGNAVSNPSFSVPLIKPVAEFEGPLPFDDTHLTTTHQSETLPVKGGDSWTINQFVYMDESPKDLTIISGLGDARDRNGAERFLVKSQGQILFWGSNIDIPAGKDFDLHRWQMITFTYDGKTLRIYKDGQFLKSENIELTDATASVRLAPRDAWGNGNRFHGKIAKFTVWNVALPGASVKALLPTGPQN